ncbi:PadR family transcriptional regulator [Periweissella cryptocerci]|uniref:PadR family transcriptional regulator n=1 Tax=Periweissella cryptocerci TaxID=2506420 RepID=A0A4P6YWS8_9LACO|nr:PadR family transcriptional regulator [Periweissella cryptocerci]QBO37298.1 PadR family transcriptional regulator [Periweissella cryptocerci]
MAIQIPTELLDGAVLAILAEENLYGYALTKRVQAQLPVSESTMYPVLRRLKKNEALTTYDEPFEGRMRRYYQLTALGRQQLQMIQADWHGFSAAINHLLIADDKQPAKNKLTNEGVE